MGRIDMERQIEELRRQVNAREPNGIIPWILIELEGRARKADKNREAGCGSTFSGISYGLRDAIALIRSKFE